MLTDVESALRFAASAHGGQEDKNGDPYILHVARVGSSLWRFTDDFIIAGFLHDVVEDTGYTLADLERLGAWPRVVQAVDSVTKRPNESHEDAVRRAMSDPIGLWVKAADVLDNASRVHELPDVEDRHRLLLKYARAIEVLRGRLPGLRIGGALRPEPFGVLAHWGA
jgi:(p)ppGpp synthase/HD superfamily hydrolase